MLALAMTSAGSQRHLAALVGVTHQRIGRWLREGLPGGAKSIPDAFIPAIEAAFALHADVSREQASADRLPFDPELPVFLSRPRRLKRDKAGLAMIGERAIATQTQYMRADLRNRVVASQHKSRQYAYVSVVSTVDLYSYLKIDRSDPIDSGELMIETPGMLVPYLDRERYLGPTNAAAPLATKKENLMPGTAIGLALRSLNSKLSQKHEPHAVPGRLADELIFKTIPGQYENFDKLQAQAARRAAAPKRVRKPAPKSTLRNRR